MKNYSLAIFMVLSLLAQQAVAGVFNATMLAHSLSISTSSEDLSMSNMDMHGHEHHSMASHGDSAQQMNMHSHFQAQAQAQTQASSADCCSAGSQCDQLCSASVVINFSEILASPSRSYAIWHYSSEPLAQSMDTLFRPPIFA